MMKIINVIRKYTQYLNTLGPIYSKFCNNLVIIELPVFVVLDDSSGLISGVTGGLVLSMDRSKKSNIFKLSKGAKKFVCMMFKTAFKNNLENTENIASIYCLIAPSMKTL